jgi:hypothetical protein
MLPHDRKLRGGLKQLHALLKSALLPDTLAQVAVPVVTVIGDG